MNTLPDGVIFMQVDPEDFDSVEDFDNGCPNCMFPQDGNLCDMYKCVPSDLEDEDELPTFTYHIEEEL